MNALNKLLDELAHEIKMGDARRVLEKRILPVLEAGQALRDYLGPRVTCIGFPDCDGDLAGEEHSKKCVAARKPSRTENWDAAVTRLAGEGSSHE
jgi:hypothetical protein